MSLSVDTNSRENCPTFSSVQLVRQPNANSHTEWLAQRFIASHEEWITALVALLRLKVSLDLPVVDRHSVRSMINHMRGQYHFRVSNAYIPTITRYIKEHYPELKDVIS